MVRFRGKLNTKTGGSRDPFCNKTDHLEASLSRMLPMFTLHAITTGLGASKRMHSKVLGHISATLRLFVVEGVKLMAGLGRSDQYLSVHARRRLFICEQVHCQTHPLTLNHKEPWL